MRFLWSGLVQMVIISHITFRRAMPHRASRILASSKAAKCVIVYEILSLKRFPRPGSCISGPIQVQRGALHKEQHGDHEKPRSWPPTSSRSASSSTKVSLSRPFMDGFDSFLVQIGANVIPFKYPSPHSPPTFLRLPPALPLPLCRLTHY